MPANTRRQKYNIHVASRLPITVLARLAEHYKDSGRTIRSISELVRDALADYVRALDEATNQVTLEDNDIATVILQSLNLLSSSEETERTLARTDILDKHKLHLDKEFIKTGLQFNAKVPRDKYELALKEYERIKQEQIAPAIIVKPSKEQLDALIKGNNQKDISGRQGEDGPRTIQEQIDSSPNHPIWRRRYEASPNSEEAIYWWDKYGKTGDNK